MTHYVERRSKYIQYYKVAAIVVFILNILDLVSTYLAFSTGAEELNIVADLLITTHIWFVPLIFPFKILLCASIIFGAWVMPRKQRIQLGIVITAWWVAGVYSLVVVLNFLTYFGIG